MYFLMFHLNVLLLKKIFGLVWKLLLSFNIYSCKNKRLNFFD